MKEIVKRIIRYFGEYVLRGLDRVLVALVPVTIDDNRIVLLRLDNIGDFVLWLDAARQIRDYYHDKKITLFANQAFSALAQAIPYWDEVVPVDVRKMKSNPAYRWRLLCYIRGLGAMRVINPVFSRVFLVGDSMVRASGARYRIGSVGDLANITVRQRQIAMNWYTTLLPAKATAMHEMERAAEFVTGLTGSLSHVGVGHIPPVAASVERLIPDDEYVVIFPGASWVGRMWPTEKFVACAEQVYAIYGLKAVVCGGPDEMKIGEAIAVGITTHQVTDLTGRTTLLELVEVVRRSKLLISNETSAAHLAASVNTPSICITGGGHYSRFIPYPVNVTGCKPLPVIHRMDCFGCDWKCSREYNAGDAVPCVAHIEVDDVLEAVALLAAETTSSVRPVDMNL